MPGLCFYTCTHSVYHLVPILQGSLILQTAGKMSFAKLFQEKFDTLKLSLIGNYDMVLVQ